MGRIPDHAVEEVRSRADIVQVVGRHVTLNKKGAGFWGLCPFHNEKTPSFHVHPDRQIFHCFGCGVGGDVFGFKMRHEGLDFPDAVRSLARELGVQIQETGASSGRSAETHRVLDAAAEFYRQTLRDPAGAAARSYLEKRGVPAELVERYGIGFALPRWDGLLERMGRSGVSPVALERAGLVLPRQTGSGAGGGGDGYYDRFRGRVVFPIAEASGRVVGFGARGLGDETPKYLNSPDSPVYHKGRVLFGLPQALDAIRRRGRVVVVEGYFDVLALARAGVLEAVAPCGTALTRDHANRLSRYAPEVVLLFDGDDAGRAAAERTLPLLLGEGLRVRAALLPLGDDPDTLLEREGPEALRDRIDSSQPLLDQLLDERLGDPGSHAWAASDAVRSVAPFLRAIADPIERASYERLLAGRLELPLDAVQRSLRTDDRQRASSPSSPPPRDGSVRGDAEKTGAPSAVLPEKLGAVTRVMVSALAIRPDLTSLVEELDFEMLPGEADRALLTAVVAALRDRGAGAIAHLLSPASDVLSPALARALAEIVAAGDPGDDAVAEQSIRDCVKRLRQVRWKQRSRAVSAQLRETEQRPPTAAEVDVLLAEKQKLLDEKRRAELERDALDEVSPGA